MISCSGQPGAVEVRPKSVREGFELNSGLSMKGLNLLLVSLSVFSGYNSLLPHSKNIAISKCVCVCTVTDL